MTNSNAHIDALDFLGTILDATVDAPERDAVHLAVFRAMAVDRLQPCDHVRLRGDGNYAYWANPGKGIGIVDPFLTTDVLRSEEFYIVLYPRTITSLAHVWEHPAFPAAQDVAQAQDIDGAARAASEAWLRRFVDDLEVNTYGEYEAFDSIINAAVRDPSYVRVGFDCYGEIPPAFWQHLSIYTGEDYVSAPDKSEYFSCAC